MFVRSAYNYDSREASREVAVFPGDEPSRAVQSARKDADINTIVKRFLKTGELPQVRRGEPIAGFVTSLEYREALDSVRQAGQEFERLPAAVRRHFNNDPGAFLEACFDDSRLPELRSLGLAEPERRAPSGMSEQEHKAALAAAAAKSPPEGGQGA